MHLPPSEHARFLKIAGAGLLLVGIVFGSTGCADPAAETMGYSPFGTIDTIATTTASRDSALAVLTAMNRTAFDSSFARLDAYAATRHVRTEQLDTTGRATAYRTLTLHYEPGAASGTVLRSDGAGTFPTGGLLAGITPAPQPTARPENLAAQALSDQPAYLAPRTREAYRYVLRGDSLLDGTRTYVVEAKARGGGIGADQDVRYARLTIDRTTNELVGLVVVRASRILLFRERSQVTVRLHRAPGKDPDTSNPADGPWVPRLTRFRAAVAVPFRTSRQFRTVSAYYGYSQ